MASPNTGLMVMVENVWTILLYVVISVVVIVVLVNILAVVGWIKCRNSPFSSYFLWIAIIDLVTVLVKARPLILTLGYDIFSRSNDVICKISAYLEEIISLATFCFIPALVIERTLTLPFISWTKLEKSTRRGMIMCASIILVAAILKLPYLIFLRIQIVDISGILESHLFVLNNEMSDLNNRPPFDDPFDNSKSRADDTFNYEYDFKIDGQSGDDFKYLFVNTEAYSDDYFNSDIFDNIDGQPGSDFSVDRFDNAANRPGSEFSGHIFDNVADRQGGDFNGDIFDNTNDRQGGDFNGDIFDNTDDRQRLRRFLGLLSNISYCPSLSEVNLFWESIDKIVNIVVQFFVSVLVTIIYQLPIVTAIILSENELKAQGTNDATKVISYVTMLHLVQQIPSVIEQLGVQVGGAVRVILSILQLFPLLLNPLIYFGVKDYKQSIKSMLTYPCNWNRINRIN